MLELRLSEYRLVAPLFWRSEAPLLMSAVLAGNQPAVIWAERAPQPAWAMLWDKAHNLYVAGEVSGLALESLWGWVGERLAGAADFVVLHPLSDPWKAVVAGGNTQVAVKVFDRHLYRLERAPVAVACPEGVELAPIDDAILLSKTLANAERLRAEVRQMWRSLDRFLENGFGWCALADGEVLGWCTAEYVSKGLVGFGVETVEPWQGRGIATALAVSCAKEAQSLGLTAHWECWAGNDPSVRVARKVGYELACQYQVFGATPR